MVSKSERASRHIHSATSCRTHASPVYRAWQSQLRVLSVTDGTFVKPNPSTDPDRHADCVAKDLRPQGADPNRWFPAKRTAKPHHANVFRQGMLGQTHRPIPGKGKPPHRFLDEKLFPHPTDRHGTHGASDPEAHRNLETIGCGVNDKPLHVSTSYPLLYPLPCSR